MCLTGFTLFIIIIYISYTKRTALDTEGPEVITMSAFEELAGERERETVHKSFQPHKRCNHTVYPKGTDTQIKMPFFVWKMREDLLE